MLAEAGIVSHKSTMPDSTTWDNYSYIAFPAASGVHIMDDSLTTKKKRTRCMSGLLGTQDDYLQFTLNNDGEKKKTYTLSFMFRFKEIAIDSSDYIIEKSDYVLPLKLIALDEKNNETLLKNSIKIPYPCAYGSFNKEYFEISETVNVPAGEKIRLQLKLDGELPKCQIPSQHIGAESEPHPVVYSVDNIAISSGSPTVISMKKGETYQLQLGTVTDTIEYYTNSYLAQYTHNDNETTCTRFNSVVANVDKTSGLITAETQGETALIAVITHEDGTVERKQCIIKVEE